MNGQPLLKGAAHRAFDRLWQEPAGALDIGRARRSNRYMKARRKHQRRARDTAYAWLGDQLGLAPGTCHFGNFDAATLAQVLAICRAADSDHVRQWRQAS